MKFKTTEFSHLKNLKKFTSSYILWNKTPEKGWFSQNNILV